MKKLTILVIGLMLVAAACNKTNNGNENPAQTPNNSNTQTEQPTTTTPPAATPAPTPVVINMTAAGFSPANVTVKKGQVVTFQNMDTKAHWPASAPHPTHTALPGFDSLKGVAAGSSYSYTFNQAGSWNFHDHLNASLFGKVTVTE